MIWVGILASAAGMFCVIWVAYAVLRIKHVRVMRVLVTLEWLVLTPTVRPQQPGSEALAQSLQVARRTWDEAHGIFRCSIGQYLRLAWNASSRDLYWANRFGAELFRLSRSLVPLERFPPEHADHRARYDLVAQHINDFALLAGRILLPRHRREG